MKTTYVSDLSVSNAMRRSTRSLHADLVKATTEQTTGRYDDMGLQLGSRAGYSVRLQQDNSYMQSIIDTNALVKSRTDASQAALDAIRTALVGFKSDLVTAQKAETGAKTAETMAVGNLKTMVSLLNTSFGGEYVFAGVNTDVQPAVDFTADPPPASATAVTAAFTGYFGFPPGDPLAADIDKAQIQSFIDGPFAALFDDPAWGATWSSASNQNVRSRISPDELVETSVNANETAVRKVAMAYTMVGALGGTALNRDAFSGLVDRAISVAGEGVTGVVKMQERLGIAQTRIEEANTGMNAQIAILTKQVGVMEEVDPYEAAERVKMLTTQLDTSYALTSRIHQLSLLKYL